MTRKAARSGGGYRLGCHWLAGARSAACRR